MSYWPLEFPAIWLSVLGVDLVFSAGTLFIATFALPHEQSMAGALFNTMIQVNPFCPPESNQNIDESFFFFKKKQLGISFGITVTTFVFDKVTRATPTGADMILSYQYATWTSGAFGLIGIYLFYISLFSFWPYIKFCMILAFVLGVLSFRGVGAVGHRGSKTSPVEEGNSESASNSESQLKEVTKTAKEEV